MFLDLWMKMGLKIQNWLKNNQVPHCLHAVIFIFCPSFQYPACRTFWLRQGSCVIPPLRSSAASLSGPIISISDLFCVMWACHYCVPTQGVEEASWRLQWWVTPQLIPHRHAQQQGNTLTRLLAASDAGSTLKTIWKVCCRQTRCLC